MPKTEHWQWYVEQFSPAELHHHAVEETYFSGRTPFQQVAVIRTAAFGKMLVLDNNGKPITMDYRRLPAAALQAPLTSIDAIQ